VVKLALYVPLRPKPGKEQEIADFLCSALPLVNAEPGRISWFALREDSTQFAMYGTYRKDAPGEEHLEGKITKVLLEKAKAGELFVGKPEIREIRILSLKQLPPNLHYLAL
jgi:quinol monooxygenase YgiN